MGIEVRNRTGLCTISVILMLLASWMIFLDVLSDQVFYKMCMDEIVCTARPGIWLGVAFLVTGIVGVRLSHPRISDAGRKCYSVLYLLMTLLSFIAAAVYFFLFLIRIVLPPTPDSLKDVIKEGVQLIQTATMGLDTVRQAQLVVVAAICLVALIGSCFGCCNACCNNREVRTEIVCVRPIPQGTTITVASGSPMVFSDATGRHVNVVPQQYPSVVPVALPLDQYPGAPPSYAMADSNNTVVSPQPQRNESHNFSWTKFNE